MTRTQSLISLFTAGLLLATLASCDTGGKKQQRGPIVLGDSATIVTETDSQYLLDIVPELDFQKTQPPAGDTTKAQPAAPKPADTVATTPATQSPSGLRVDFGDFAVVLPGATAPKMDHNYKGKSSAALSTRGQSLGAENLIITGAAKISKIQQRNTYAVVAKEGNTQLWLQDLRTQTGQWRSLKGGGNSYTIAAEETPTFRFSAAAVKNAAQKAARAARMNKKDENQLLNAIPRNGAVRGPLRVATKSITWKIDGKDASGKTFSKELRVDIPL